MFKRLIIIAVLCAIGLASPLIVLPFAGSTSEAGSTLFWLVDLGTHWQLLYGALLAVSAVAIAAITRNGLWLLLLGLCALPLVTAGPGAERIDASPSASADALTIVSANVYFENEDSKPLVTWATARNADIVIVSEVSIAFGEQLGKLQAFPHRKIVTRGDPFGIAILSRHPFDSIEELKTEDGIPFLRAVVRWKDRTGKDRPIAVTAVHPLPPITTNFMAERDKLLLSEARKLKERALPALLAGDLNATVWSAGMAGPASMGLLRTTSLAPTWPTWMFGLMGIPIDHVLVSGHWQVVTSAVGPDVGSDHFPVMTVLRLK